jgi:GAF domain-containing protein
MNGNENDIAAAAAFLGDTEREHRALLASVVQVAREIFDAAAASVFLLDSQSGELVFEAVSGAGEDHLIDQHFPADRGIAGWVLAAQEPLVVADLANSPIFARDIAESTGYVPRSLMAAPLIHHDEPVGVLEVLDPKLNVNLTSTLSAAGLLTLFAAQAAIALGVLRRNRGAYQVLSATGTDHSELTQMARFLGQLGDDQRAAGTDLLNSLSRLLAAR